MVFEKQLIFEQEKAESRNKKNIRDNEMYNELERKKLEFNGQSEVYQMELEVKKEGKKQQLK